MAEFHQIAGYDVLATLGYGARSTIYAVRDGQGNRYALKLVRKTSPSDQRFIAQAVHEHQIASRFNHPSLRQSYKLIRDRSFLRTKGVMVLMELVDGTTLEQTQPDSIAEMVAICRQVASGLGLMHAEGYVHADIKPNNIMLTAGDQVKIIDFGQSCPTGTIKERIQGTPDYIAPEQVKRRMITPQTDVFNFGATMYWLLTRRHVPTLIPKGEVGVSLRTDDRCVPPIELNDKVPPALSTLVMHCIETNPKDRPENMAQVVDRLEVASSQITRRQQEQERVLRRTAS